MPQPPLLSQRGGLCRINLWARGAAAPGPAPRGAPHLEDASELKKERRSWERKKREKRKREEKKGIKEKGKVKEIVFGTKKLTERFPSWSIERF